MRVGGTCPRAQTLQEEAGAWQRQGVKRGSTSVLDRALLLESLWARLPPCTPAPRAQGTFCTS